ncbi:MAG: ABC transporter permease [Chloroflexota bacterium]|nr:MAG: ABC transporter permease [Chloroflexota bacterium]
MKSTDTSGLAIEQTLADGLVVREHESMTRLVWRRFRRHPGAVAGAVILSVIILASIFAFLSPYNPNESDIKSRLEPPSLQHPFGTDALGRDLLTRCLYGGRISLFVGLMVMVITLVIGIPIGMIAGYFGGWIDDILMRIIDAFLSLPSLLVLILLSAILREIEFPLLKANSVMTIALVIGFLSWTTIARLVRAVFLGGREMDYVNAARALGAGSVLIMLSEILPNGFGPIIVDATLEIGYAIMEESGLSFLGFGVMPPTASWGSLLSDAQQHLTKHPWLAIFPGLMIFFTIISINYIGDGLRDALDPYKVLSKIDE